MDESDIHDLLSGRRTGVLAGVLRGMLTLASCGYAVGTNVRNLAYDRGWFASHNAAAPVISLGNITTGGTGKTPLAAWLANWLMDQGCRPGLLSRGYRSLSNSSQTPTGNDEKMVLDRLCPGVPHLQQPDRVGAAQRLVTESGCDVLILDDGFQHRRLFRELDLLLIDALQPWGYGFVLPRGLLREPVAGIRRADLVIITRADQSSERDRQRLKDTLARLRGAADCVEVAFTPQRLIGLDGTARPIGELRGLKTTAFCGIGNPSGFRQTLASLNIAADLKVFPDHHHYQASDLQTLGDAAKAVSADAALTTLKDLVKISANSWTGPPLYAIEIAVDFLSGRELLLDRLNGLIARRQR